MAPARTRGAKKRHCRSASAPERTRNCAISIVNGFKMASQSNFSSVLMYVLFCVVLLSNNAQSLSTRDNIDCTYANSTCSYCADLCLDNGEFYPLFPSRCHPSYMSLIHSEESYPGRTSSSVQFYGNSSFSVPADLLESLTALKRYTIAVYFREQVPNGTLFELNNQLVIRYTSELQLEVFLPQLTEKNRNTIATYEPSLSGQWKSVFFTFEDQSELSWTLLTHIGSEAAIDPLNPAVEFPSTINSITIGSGFNGLLQDIRVYVPELAMLNSQVVIPPEAAFLPQCLCPSGNSISQGETGCTAMDQSTSARYDMNARTAEFSTDTSTTTMWQSNDNDSPVSLVVGLSPVVSLSKIFITFNSNLPVKTTLQYYSEQISGWRDLQYFAEDCMQSFEMGNDDQLKGSFDVNCLHYTSATTLTFLLAGTGSNARPLPSEDAMPFEIYYNASRVRLIMSDFMNSATNFAISDFEICPNYCLDLERSCTTICPETAGMMTGDEGSGMSISDMLMPSSTVPTALVPSMSTTSSVENNQGNSNIFVSMVTSTSAEMTEINTAPVPSMSTTSSVENNQGNSSTFVSMVMSTSAGMTEVSAALVPSVSTTSSNQGNSNTFVSMVMSTSAEMASTMSLQSTTMSFNIPTTMTFISSATMPIAIATSSVPPITEPESTTVRDQPTSTSLAADMLTSSSITPNPMTSAIFNPPSTVIAMPQAPSTTTIDVFTSMFSSGIPTSAVVPLTPTPSTTVAMVSSTPASSSLQNQGVATSSSEQQMIQTSSTVVQESLSMIRSEAVSLTNIQATTTQDVGVLTSQTEEVIATSFIASTSTTSQMPITLARGVTTTVQPSAASVQPESTSPTSISTTATILSSISVSESVALQESPSSSPGPVSTPTITDIEPSETSTVATSAQSVEPSITSSSSGSSADFISLSRTPGPTGQSSAAFEPTAAPTDLVDQSATIAPSISSLSASTSTVADIETTEIISMTGSLPTASVQTVQVSAPLVTLSQSVGQISSVAIGATILPSPPTATQFASTDTTALPSPMLSMSTARESLDTASRASSISSIAPIPMSPIVTSTPVASPIIVSETSAQTSSTTSSFPLLLATGTSIPMTDSVRVSSLSATTTLDMVVPTPQPTISSLITAAETSIVSESSLQTNVTFSIPMTIGSDVFLSPSSTEPTATSLPTSTQIAPIPTPTMVIPLTTSAATMIISAEGSSVSISPETATSLPSIEAQPTSQAFTFSGMLTSPIEITQTPTQTMIATSGAVASTSMAVVSSSATSGVAISSTPVISTMVSPSATSGVLNISIPIFSTAVMSQSEISNVMNSSAPSIVSTTVISQSATSDIVSSSTLIFATTTMFPDLGSGDDFLTLEPFTETSQIPTLSSTPTSTSMTQLTTFTSPSSPVTIPSLVISTPTPPLSSISSVSAIISASETSIAIFPTSTPVAVSSITPTPLLPSAPIPSPSIFSPTPTPTPALLPTPTFLPFCETPLAPIQVDADGLGFILDEDVTRDESDEYGLTYTVTFGEFIGQSGQLSRSGTLNAMFGRFNGQSTMYDLDADSITSLTGFISDSEVWSDDPSVSVAFQVRDDSFDSNIDAECEITLTNRRNGAAISTTNCSISAPCGTSPALLDIPKQWFTESGTTEVDIEVIVEQKTFELGSVSLRPTGPTQIDTTVFMIPPKRSLLPGEEFRVPIYASFDRRLAGFSLDCRILGSAAELSGMGAESSLTWSLLPRKHPSDSGRISLTGFRNYDRTNTNRINFTESLADLVISIRQEDQIDDIEAAIEIQCEMFKLVLTNGTDLVEEQDIKYVRSLNRDGEISIGGRVHIEPRKYAGIFACTDQNEIVNTARLTMEMDEISMSIYGFNITSSKLDPLSIGAICSSENESIIKVDTNCTYVYFDGSETYGANEVSITVTLPSFEANGSIPFRVWLPSQEISITLADDTLNAIESVATCENGSTLYQRSSFAIMTTIATDTNLITVYVTSLLRPYLTVSDESIAVLTEDRQFIEGIDVGIITIYVSTLGEMYGTEINVTNDTVEAVCLDIFAFSSISVEIPDEIIDMGTATITLEQEFDFIGSNLNILPVIQFSDNSRMLLTEEYNDGLEITIDGPELDIVLQQSIPPSVNSYEVVGPISEFNISISWQLESLQECENITFITNDSFVYSESTEAPTLIVNATSDYLTASDDAAIYFDTPDYVLLEVYLNYGGMFTSNITSHDSVTFDVLDNSKALVRLVDHLGSMRRVETNGTRGGNATIVVTFAPLNLTTEYVITVKRTESFTLSAYRESDNTEIVQLNQIGSSGVYQRAILGASVNFMDGTMEKVPNAIMRVVVVSNNADIIAINRDDLEINFTGSAADAGNVSLQATIINSNIRSSILDIIVDSNPIEVSDITSITLSSTSAEVNETLFADCTAVLTDDTILTTTFYQDGSPIYPGLITFSTDDPDILDIEQNSSAVMLLKNPLTKVSLIASAMENITYRTQYNVSLNPSQGEVGLKTTATQVETGDMFEISVVLNSAQEAVGVYELEFGFEPNSQLEIVNIVQGESWKNGTIISAVKSSGVITIGGVLNTGAKSNLAELAVVTLKAEQAGDQHFNISIDYTANTDVIPSIVNMQSSSHSGQLDVRVSDSSPMSKREAPQSYVYDYFDEWSPYEYTSPSRLRSKRQTCTPTQMDPNGDCVTDLRDVYVLQEFIASEVYNFSTTRGEQLAESGVTVDNIGEPIISQIFTIERNSLDLSFTIPGIFYTFFLQDNSGPCQFLINGTINTALEFMDIVNVAQIYLDFSHDNASFQEEFDSTFVDEDVVARKNGIDGQYGGTITAQLSNDERGNIVFVILANSTIQSEAFNISVLLDVQVNIVNQFSSSFDIGSLSIETVYVTSVSGVIESCTPTTEAPITTQVASTSTIVATTQALTTTAVEEITTTVEPTTQFPTSITTTISATPLLTTTAIVTTTAVMEVPITTTIVEAPTTVTPSIAATSETSTVLDATVSSMAITTSESPTSIATTQVPSIMSTPTVIATTTIMATTEAPTTVATTFIPTTVAATQAATSMATSATSSQSTMATQVIMVSSVAPTTVAPTVIGSTVASMITMSPTPVISMVLQITTSTEASISTINIAMPNSSTVSTSMATSVPMISTAAPMSTSSVIAPITTSAQDSTTATASSVAQTTITSAVLTTESSVAPTTITSAVLTTESSVAPTTITSAASTPTSSVAPTTIRLVAPTSTSSVAPTTSISVAPSTTSAAAPSTTADRVAPMDTSTVITSRAATTSLVNIMDLVSTTTPVTSIASPMATSTPVLTPTSAPDTAAPTPTTTPVSTIVSKPTIVPMNTTSVAVPGSTDSVPPTSVISSIAATSSVQVLTTTAIADTTEQSTTATTESSAPTMATKPSTETMATTDRETGATGSSSSSTIIAISATLGLIAGTLAIVVVIFVAMYLAKRYRKRGGYSPRSNLTTPSRRNKGYFFEEEENVELNPVNCDLVPMDSMNHGFFMANGAESMNLVPNHQIYQGDLTTGEDAIMSGSSTKPLLREPPEPGRQAPIRGKQFQYSESTMDNPPPPYHATGTTFTGTTLTSKSGNSTSPYDIEDDYFDLPFNDDPTQAYLSLGLTPQSQLSPADHTGSGSDGNNFFPSMPPPVMPSAFNAGIPADSPFNISGSSGGGMVMPDAFPGVTDQPRKGSGGSRRSRHDHNPLSQGYPIKLPPVPEQSDPMEDGLYNGGRRRRSRQEMFSDDNSSGSSVDETSFMFPSADLDSSNSSQLQRQKGMRKKSGMRRVDNGWSQSSQDGMVFSNRNAIGNHHDDDDIPERDIPLYDLGGSPRHKGKYIRQQAKERELQKQREILKKKAADEEKRRILQQEKRAAMIARDYGSTRYREVDIDEQVEKSQGSSRVLQEAMKYEAQMQLMQERVSQSSGLSYDRMSQERQQLQRHSSNGRIINTYDQFTTI